MALSTSGEDYLRAIWKLGEWQDKPVSSGQLAKALGLSPSTVSEGVSKLVAKGLVRHAPYGAITLTGDGQLQAARMVRIHRLLETGLVELFGYSWDEVHDEAEHLEHAVSDKFIERLDQTLGHPERDPHGDVIPAADGSYPVQDEQLHSLIDIQAGTTARIDRVSDRDSEVLIYLESVGLVPGVDITVIDVRRSVGLLSLRLDNSSLDIPLAAARSVIVRPDSPQSENSSPTNDVSG